MGLRFQNYQFNFHSAIEAQTETRFTSKKEEHLACREVNLFFYLSANKKQENAAKREKERLPVTIPRITRSSSSTSSFTGLRDAITYPTSRGASLELRARLPNFKSSRVPLFLPIRSNIFLISSLLSASFEDRRYTGIHMHECRQ